MTDNGASALLSQILEDRRRQFIEGEAIEAEPSHEGKPGERDTNNPQPKPTEPTARSVPADAGPAPLAVDAKQLSTMLGLSVRTIRTMDAAGKLPRPVRLGHAVRWSLDEIREWLAAGAPDRRTWQAKKEARR